MAFSKTPVVFIHGLWLHCTSWQPWLDLFVDSGYLAMAPGWPGHQATVEQTRSTPASVANFGIDDVTAHFRSIIQTLGQAPILIGHSFGGMIAEKLLEEGYGTAAITIDATQIKHVLPRPLSAIHATLPSFRDPAGIHRAITLTPEQFRQAFCPELTEDESSALYETWSIAAPGRPLFEAAMADFSLHPPERVAGRNADRAPLLLIMSKQNRAVRESTTRASLRRYRRSCDETSLIEFGDRGHSLTIDDGWSDVADLCVRWLDKQGLAPVPVPVPAHRRLRSAPLNARTPVRVPISRFPAP